MGSHENGDDFGPVRLNLPLRQQRSADELPYRMRHSRLKQVMSSWATNPALDSKLPAGLSPTVIQEELRGRLGLRGVTITDQLNAGRRGPLS